MELAELAYDAGLPAGVLNCVPGLGSIAGQALATHPGIKKIDFTGGTATGRRVAAAAGGNLASSTMELGGKAPLVVFDDVDVAEVADGAAFACFIASGQTCVTGARIIVHESIADDFVSRFVGKATAIRLGDPMDDKTQMGTIISEQHLLRIHGMVERARAAGATIKCGGQRAPGLSGYFYEPTVITDVTPDMEIVQEEVFGPVVSVYTFKVWVGSRMTACCSRHVVLIEFVSAGRSRGRRARQQLAVRTRRRGLDLQHQARSPCGAPTGCRHHLAQRPPPQRPVFSVGWHEGQRHGVRG